MYLDLDIDLDLDFELNSLKEKEQTATWTEKQALFKRKCLLRNLSMLNVYGFNSSRFDLSVLVGYLQTYAQKRNMELKLLKKGSRYFNISIGANPD